MKRMKLNCGHIAYEVSQAEVMLLGGFGICDNCNTAAGKGYLVPVLNRWLCPKCFEAFNSRAKFYPEDLWVEEKNCRYYESIIPMDGGCSEWMTSIIRSSAAAVKEML